MQPANHPAPRNTTRIGYRVAAGVLGLFILTAGLPVTLLNSAGGDWLEWLLAAYCLLGGGGLALGAYTDRWYHCS